MAETPGPTEHWAILQTKGSGPQLLVGIYVSSEHAIQDSGALQADGSSVEVVPFPVHNAPQWSSYREPAWELDDEDFDVPIPDAATPGIEA